jgi:hypothetical protein
MRLGTWNVKEHSKYRLDLVAVWSDGKAVASTSRRRYIFYGKWNENHELGTGDFMHKRIISAVKRVHTWRKVVSPMHRPRSTKQKHYFSASGTYFC